MKSKLVRIDLEVFEALRDKAFGFETPNALLRRMLNMPPPRRIGRPRKRAGKEKEPVEV